MGFNLQFDVFGKARDAFYACVEKESDKKQTEIASKGLLYPAECKASREEFVKHCRTSWVKSEIPNSKVSIFSSHCGILGFMELKVFVFIY